VSAAGFEVVYRSTLPPDVLEYGDLVKRTSAWHHDSYHITRQTAETRASQLILSGLQVRILEVA
jgi:hypothetical protein